MAPSGRLTGWLLFLAWHRWRCQSNERRRVMIIIIITTPPRAANSGDYSSDFVSRVLLIQEGEWGSSVIARPARERCRQAHCVPPPLLAEVFPQIRPALPVLPPPLPQPPPLGRQRIKLTPRPKVGQVAENNNPDLSCFFSPTLSFSIPSTCLAASSHPSMGRSARSSGQLAGRLAD